MLVLFCVVFGYGPFEKPTNPPLSYHILWVICFIGFVGMVQLIYGMLSVEGIYLYEDRVIKRLRWGKEKKIFLDKAKYTAFESVFLYMPATTKIVDEDDSWLLRGYKGVFFPSSLVSRKNLRRFRQVLSEITGIDIENVSGDMKLMQKRKISNE